MSYVRPSLAGQIALVTGASRGVGRGIALQLGEAGATVYITGRNADDLQRTCKEVVIRGAADAIAIVMDHSNVNPSIHPCMQYAILSVLPPSSINFRWNE